MLQKLNLDFDFEKIVDDYRKLNLDQILIDNKRQYCLQKRPEITGNLQYVEGAQSLEFDWEGYDPTIHKHPKLRKKFLKQEEFTEVCDLYRGMYIGEVIQYLYDEYHASRGRLMMLDWKTCLTYHADATTRLHVPIVTNENCFMVINDNVVRLPFGDAYIVDTKQYHTAINASKTSRTHMVFCLPK